MTREHAKELLPIITSYVNGSGGSFTSPIENLTISLRKVVKSTNPTLNFDIWEDSNKTIEDVIVKGKLREPDVKGLPHPSQEFIQLYCDLGGTDEIWLEADSYYDVKVNEDGTVNTKTVKEEWNKEDIDFILNKILNDRQTRSIVGINSNFVAEYVTDWIKNNLD